MTLAPERVSAALSRIEAELAAIWRPDAEGSAKPHATTLNLIAVHGQNDGEAFRACAEEVAARLGARTFLVSVDGRLEPWVLAGDVSAVCRLEPGTRQAAVCAERVTLVLGAAVAKRASSILQSLVEASLPAVLLIGPGAHAAVVDALVPEAQEVVLDSAELGLTRACELAAAAPGRVDDLAFVRVRRWREMTARFFDDPELRPALTSIDALEIRHVRRPDHAGASAEAELVVAWLGARLGWRPAGTEILDASGRPVRILVDSVDRSAVLPGCLVSLTLRARLATGTVVGRVVRADDGQHLVWELEASGSHPAAHRYAIPRRDDAELVERAIRNTAGDWLARETMQFARRWKDGR